MKINTRFYHISLNSSENEKCFRQNLYRKSKHVLCSVVFFPENCANYEAMLQNVVQPDRSHMTIQYGACALHAGCLKLKHTLRVSNTCCFSTATVVDVTLRVITSLVLLRFI
jgi:N-acetyl-gamma-glutamylphosphate reductase